MNKLKEILNNIKDWVDYWDKNLSVEQCMFISAVIIFSFIMGLIYWDSKHPEDVTVAENKCYDVYIPEKCVIINASTAYHDTLVKPHNQLSVTCYFEDTGKYETFARPVDYKGGAWFVYHPTKDFGSMIVREMKD